MTIIKVPKELENLDRNDIDKVCELVDKLVDDIMSTYYFTEKDEEVLAALITDYMIDLINPDLLDFDKEGINEKRSC
jgi:hypothetical protein